jgi:hypothetical protein
MMMMIIITIIEIHRRVTKFGGYLLTVHSLFLHTDMKDHVLNLLLAAVRKF